VASCFNSPTLFSPIHATVLHREPQTVDKGFLRSSCPAGPPVQVRTSFWQTLSDVCQPKAKSLCLWWCSCGLTLSNVPKGTSGQRNSGGNGHLYVADLERHVCGMFARACLILNIVQEATGTYSIYMFHFLSTVLRILSCRVT
jgi:hypothetical protein